MLTFNIEKRSICFLNKTHKCNVTNKNDLHFFAEKGRKRLLVKRLINIIYLLIFNPFALKNLPIVYSIGQN